MNKGNSSLILFLRSMRCHDYDNDWCLYLNEFQKSIEELKLKIKYKDIKAIFQIFEKSQKLKIHDVIERLKISFGEQEKQQLLELYDHLKYKQLE